MGYLHDYIDFCKDMSFEQLPFNEIDGVILAMLPLLDCSISFPKKGKRTLFNCVARHVRIHELNSLGMIITSDIAKMIYRVSKTKRFHDLKIHSFSTIIDITTETQATSLVVDINDDLSVVVFSGTDDTIVGWKEDFNMMYNHHVPCLEHSLMYLNKIGKELSHFYIVGHSKGGMEAMYAYSFTTPEIQNKVIKVYSYDGPGLAKEVVEEINQNIIDKIEHIVPQGAIIGRLFFSPVEPTIIYSSFRGLQQHNPMSWEIKRGNLGFNKVDEFNIQSKKMKEKLDKIIESFDEETAKKFIHYLFEVLSEGGSYTLTDLSKRPHKALRKYLQLPNDVRKLVRGLIVYLANDKIISKDLLLGMLGINQSR